jgi:hypothetical protein
MRNSLLTEAGRALWRLNQEYGQRLARARQCASLLTELLAIRGLNNGGQPPPNFMRIFATINETLDQCYDDHRAWRYRYFYDSVDEKRMTQNDADIFKAMAQFSRLRLRQMRPIQQTLSALAELPRPPRDLTRIPQGDLWEMTTQALVDFAELDTALSP